MVGLAHRCLCDSLTTSTLKKTVQLTGRHWVQTQWQDWGQSYGFPCGGTPQGWGSGKGSGGGWGGHLEAAGAGLSYLTKRHHHRTLQTHNRISKVQGWHQGWDPTKFHFLQSFLFSVQKNLNSCLKDFSRKVDKCSSFNISILPQSFHPQSNDQESNDEWRVTQPTWFSLEQENVKHK